MNLGVPLFQYYVSETEKELRGISLSAPVVLMSSSDTGESFCLPNVVKAATKSKAIRIIFKLSLAH
jgi:hypothetical protein